MSQQNTAVNAGVHNSIGIEFQKHCALVILFDKYSSIQGTDFFICIEHHDDIVFCYLDSAGDIQLVDSYQAKKASSKWGMSNELFEIVQKITQTGINLISDPMPKSSTYSHSLSFITNDAIGLNCGNPKMSLQKTELINESNSNVHFPNLPTEIQFRLKQKLADTLGEVVSLDQVGELQNLHFAFIDFPKKAISQKDQLEGHFRRMFGNSVNDPKAAIDTILYLFRNVETFLNNGGVAQLLDPAKRVTSREIATAFNVINSRQKAYDLWRDKKDGIAASLGIGVFQKSEFALAFENSFDLFKDLTQAEHQKILRFVNANIATWSHYTDDASCLLAIYDDFIKTDTSPLTSIELKATLFAAYVENLG